MNHMGFSKAAFANKKRETQGEIFLGSMEKLMFRGEDGRPPYPLLTMLRVQCLQLLENLSDCHGIHTV